jgi:hypothetical protein
MADIATIVDDAVAAGFDARRLAFVSVHLSFAERGPWEQATETAQSAWEVAAYGTGQGHMLRLSRMAHPTRRDLAKLRADALTFAAANDADWLSMSIEELQRPPTPWQALSTPAVVRLTAQRTPPDVETLQQVQQIRRGGTA